MSVPVRYSSFLNFYPRPPRGGRRGMRRGSPDLRNFYPRPPRGGRRRQPVQWPRRFSISIHALREEGDLPLGRNETARKISIHALREEGDVREDSQRRKDRNFYPRPPRGGRLNAFSSPWTPWEFLSTPSARRATTPSPPTSGRLCYFYPRPPRGGRRAVHRPLRGREDISIHALREEGDPNSSGSSWKRQISIHALREEGDRKHWANRVKQRNFYPRPPRGGRP